MPKLKKNIINSMLEDKHISSPEPDAELISEGNDMYWYPKYYNNDKSKLTEDLIDTLESIL